MQYENQVCLPFVDGGQSLDHDTFGDILAAFSLDQQPITEDGMYLAEPADHASECSRYVHDYCEVASPETLSALRRFTSSAFNLVDRVLNKGLSRDFLCSSLTPCRRSDF